MGFLENFEKGLERIVTGAFSKTFKSELQPIEIAAAIRAEMDAKASIVSRDRILAPNTYTVRLAADALVRCGFEPTFTLSGGAADANAFNEKGLRCLNLANGMAEIHTPDEHIAVADLEAMVDVTLALLDAAAA